MKRSCSLLFFLCICTTMPMEQPTADQKLYLQLINDRSAKPETIAGSKWVAQQSQTINDIRSDYQYVGNSPNNPLYLEPLTHKQWTLIESFLHENEEQKKSLYDMVQNDQTQLTSLRDAATFLNIKPLHEKILGVIAHYYRSNNMLNQFLAHPKPHQFNPFNLNPDEEKDILNRIKQDNKWQQPICVATMNHGNHSDYVRSVVFNYDSSLMASGTWNCTIKLFDITKPHQPKRIATIDKTNGGHNGYVNAVAFNHDGSLIASGAWDNTIKLFDITKPHQPKCIATIDKTNGGHNDYVNTVAFNHDGSLMASGALDDMIRLFDITNPHQPQCIAIIDKMSGCNTGLIKRAIQSVVFNHDSSLIASGAWDCTIKLFDITKPHRPKHIVTIDEENGGHNDYVNAVAFNHDGSLIASGAWDNTIKLFDITKSHRPKHIITIDEENGGHSDHVNAIAFSHDSSVIASGAWDNTIRLFDTTKPHQPKHIVTIDTKNYKINDGHSNYVDAVVFNHDDSIIASGFENEKIKLWQDTYYLCTTLQQALLVRSAQQHQNMTICNHTNQTLLPLYKSLNPALQNNLFQQCTRGTMQSIAP